ncbi:MAG: phosphoglycerate kinase [Bacteroidales bacterium]
MTAFNDYDFRGKRALVRVDYNVPFGNNHEITDDTRIRASLPTIKTIIDKGGIPIVMSHLGRPKGGYEEALSLKHLVSHLANLTGAAVKMANECVGKETRELENTLVHGDILLLENVRFHPEEEKGDVEFARQLSEMGDCWVNDAFGTAHRNHASTAVIGQFFSNDKMFGLLVENELSSLDTILENPKRPFTAIMGGAKVSSKIPIIENLLDKVDNLILGGGMTYTFAKAHGGNIGDSIHEKDYLDLALQIEQKAKAKGVNLIIASDVVVGDKFSNDSNTKITSVNNIDDGWEGMDAGPESIKMFKKLIQNSGTILWNGPVGVFEFDKFSSGSKAIGEAVAEATEKNGAFSLVGGGDSIACVKKFNLTDKVSYISTAGGALLEYLEGKELPGVAAVKNK